MTAVEGSDMKLDRRDLFAKLGGVAAVAAMTHEARADALEHYMMLAAAGPTGSVGSSPASMPASMAADKKPFPTVAEIEAQIRRAPSARAWVISLPLGKAM